MRSVLILAAAMLAPAAAAQDYTVMTGQSEVLNHMNRENAKRLHREKGLPEPDFEAAERRIAARDRMRAATARRAPSLSASRTDRCAFVRANLHQLRADQRRVYERYCRSN